MDTEKRNLVILVILSACIFLGFHLFYEKPRLEASLEKTKHFEGGQKGEVSPMQGEKNLFHEDKAEIALETFSIDTQDLQGNITNQGFEFSNLTLKKFRETTDLQSPLVSLLNRTTTDVSNASAFYADFGWESEDTSLKLPDASTRWKVVEGKSLTSQFPLVMVWDNGEGIEFKKVIEIDDNYMMTIRQTVHNKTTRTLRMHTQARVVRSNPTPGDYVVLHEGAVGYLDQGLKEVKYDELKKNAQKPIQSRGGWLGITDKYWLVAIVPDQNLSIETQFQAKETREGTSYEARVKEFENSINSGQSFTTTTRLFAGVKSLDLLDRYEKIYTIPHFDLAIDFGWFYFITKPLFFAVKWLDTLLGNFGLAIIVLTILVRLSFYPLANHSFHAMAKMRELQPQLVRVKELYGNDKQKLQQETMALYKKHKVNPVAGCVPILIQIPVFFALYKVLFVAVEMRHAPFYGWIQDLSAPDPTNLFTLFGLIPWTPPSFLMVGVLPLLMALTMLIQQRLNPQPTDPIQEKLFKLMPLIFLFMLARFPAGLVLYWICSNLFSIMQQSIQNARTRKAGAVVPLKKTSRKS